MSFNLNMKCSECENEILVEVSPRHGNYKIIKDGVRDDLKMAFKDFCSSCEKSTVFNRIKDADAP